MGAPDLPPDLAEVLAGAADAHRRLASTVAGLTDAQARQPSLLPGWTVGHLLTHVARNADSHRRALEGAARGEVVDRYPGGAAQRDGEIAAGAARPAAELVADVERSSASLEATWGSTPPGAWAAAGTCIGRPEPVAGLPFGRWREVEVHRSDLGLGATWRDWAPGYVRRELHLAALAWRARHGMGLTELPPAALALEPPARLAWLLGRLPVDGLEVPPPWW